MTAWQLAKEKLKKYPHFDHEVSLEFATRYATDPKKVEHHKFYPLIQYAKRWTQFAAKGEVGKVKKRLIRYAARLDSYIFSYYRHVLSELYESRLATNDLGSSVLAYRRIPSGLGKKSKSNIHFARDAVRRIQELGDCYAIALDISSFFESLDHSLLKRRWCELLGTSKLPKDHFKVFEAVTRYAYAPKLAVYERLGYFGDKLSARSKRPVRGYLVPNRRIPVRLCNSRDFQEKVVAAGLGGTIVQTNAREFGIPQGLPISDLLANMYMLNFDRAVLGWVRELQGTYFRYSDDILILVKGNAATALELMARVAALIPEHGSHLSIKIEKSSIFCFKSAGLFQTCEQISGDRKNGLEYLGFRYNGKGVYIRDSTLSGLRRRVTLSARAAASSWARRYPDRSYAKLKSTFNFQEFHKRFGRVEDFDEDRQNYRSWTFWTYADRSSKILGDLGTPIRRQLRNHTTLVQRKIEDELRKAVLRRDRRAAARP